MNLIFIPPILIFLLSYTKINRILMSIIASTVIIPALWIIFHPFNNIYFMVDKLNSFVMLISSIVGIGVSITMISLPKRIALEEKNIKRFYRFFGIFWLGLTISILSNNMGLFWIGLEFATLSTVYMIKVKPTNTAHKEAWKYLIIGAIAIALVLFGIILMYGSAKEILGANAMNFLALSQNTNHINHFLFEMGFFISTTGLFIKMGFFPMNLWLADIERSAIYPVGALFSGILESAIILGFFRFSQIEMQINYSHLIGFVYAYSIFTLFMVSFLIYKAKDFVRLFSLSGIEHMTLITLFWVSGGYFAALLHFAAHALFKPGLFLSSGILEQNGKFNFKGVLKNINPKYVSLIISALLLGVVSLPPSPMFFSEIFGFKSMIDIAKHSEYSISMIMGIVFILILLSIIFYKFVDVYQEGMYEDKNDEDKEKTAYISEKIMLILFFVSLVALLFGFDYIDTIAKGLK